jgi:Ca2+-binding RTX toxin-like protein
MGCAGDDQLIAGKLGDLIIGEEGADRLIGGAGDDVLIGASLINPITLAEDDVFSHLVNALNSPGPVVVSNDNARDVFTGASGTDAFYGHFSGSGITDLVTDKGEILFNV